MNSKSYILFLFVIFLKIPFVAAQDIPRGIDPKKLDTIVDTMVLLQWWDDYNQYFIEATLNGSKIRLLLDTASKSSDLILAGIQKLGLQEKIVNGRNLRDIDLRIDNIQFVDAPIMEMDAAIVEAGIYGIICPQKFLPHPTAILDLAGGKFLGIEEDTASLLKKLAKAYPKARIIEGNITEEGAFASAQFLSSSQETHQFKVALNTSHRYSSFRHMYMPDLRGLLENKKIRLIGENEKDPVLVQDQQIKFNDTLFSPDYVRVDYDLETYPPEIGGVIGLDVLRSFVLIMPLNGETFYIMGPF